jgi:F-type H+-transporting ATPase subunit delta
VSISLAAARIYASALFDIGADGDSLDRISDELQAVRSAIAGLPSDQRVFFELPQVRSEDKLQAIDRAFADRVSRPVLGLLHVLVDKRRELLLGAIVTEFEGLLDEHYGRLQAAVTTAHPLTTELADALRSALERQTQRQVVLHQSVDPSLIGGFRVRLGDLVVDGTLRRALSDMRRALTSSLA